MSISHLDRGREQARIKMQERKEAGLSAYRTPFEVLKDNPKSMRAAINAMCWDCQGRDSDPSVRWRIGNCVCTDCPLWTFRPHQHLEEGKEE